MRLDLHNHTILCNHASNTVDEYILKAIELGIDVYGFADHAPMNFDPKYRMSFNEKPLYESWINKAKEKYKDDIKILLAYEVDFINGLVSDEVLKSKVDYLIGSVHFINNSDDLWGFDNPEFIGVYKSKDIDSIWTDYFSCIEQMAKTNYFNIVGHFDLIKVFKYLPKKDIRTLALPALKAIKKSNMVLEINTAGLRKPIEEFYPSKILLETAFDLGIDITFSSDAHSVEQIGFKYEEGVNFAKSVGYNSCVYFEQREKIKTTF